MELEPLNEKIQKDMIWINQSKIKRLTSAFLCPQRYYLEEITGELERYSSDAMLYGNYFEYHATGQLPRDGQVPVIPDLKKQRNGSFVPATRARLDEQIKNFWKVMEKHGIKVIKTGYYMEHQFNGEIIIHGTLDALVDYCGKAYIMDIKMTGNVHNTFGDFGWGKVVDMHPNKEGVYIAKFEPDNDDAMDFIQAHAYTYMMEKKTRSDWGFLYAVFDHKPVPEYKIIEVLPESDARKNMIERLQGTKAKLKMFNELEYKAIPSSNECNGCKAVDCSVRYTQELEEGTSDILTVQAIPVLKPIDNSDPW